MRSYISFALSVIMLSSTVLGLAGCGGDSGTRIEKPPEVPFWEATNGPLGGTIQALAVSPAGDIYAGAENGGVFRSTDDGLTWTNSRTGLDNTSNVMCLAIDPDGRIFAGTRGFGVYRSVDNGATWAACNTGLTNTWPQTILASSAGALYVGTLTGVFISLDHGDSWQSKSSGLPSGWINSLARNGSGHLFAGTNGSGVYRSKNGGDSWQAINTGLTNSTVYSLAFNAMAGSIFAGTAYGVFRTDNDSLWTAVDASFPSKGCGEIAVDPDGRVYVSLGMGYGVYRSATNGASWDHLGDWIQEPYIGAYAFPETGTLIAGSDPDGIYRSMNDGDTYALSNAGLRAHMVYSLALDGAGRAFAGTFKGVFRTMDAGQTWERVFAASNIYALACNSSDHVYAGTNYDGVFRSTSNGSEYSWVSAGAGQVNKWIWSLALDSSDRIFAGTQDGIYRSTNGGDAWQSVYSTGSEPVRDIVANAGDTIFASTTRAVYRSVNHGDSWQNIFQPGCTFHSLAVSPFGHILAGFERCGIRISFDGGQYWDWTGSTSDYVRSLAVNGNGTVFAGLDVLGVKMSSDTCRTFVDTGLPYTTVWSLAIAPDGRLWAGTDAGVYRTSNPTE